MGYPTTIFTDRDGDELSVTPRDKDGNVVPDPIITVTRVDGKRSRTSQSIIMVEDEVPQIITNMVKTLSLDDTQLRRLISMLKNLPSERDGAVSAKVKEMNNQRRENINEVKRLKAAGYSNVAISVQLRIPESTIRTWLRAE